MAFLIFYSQNATALTGAPSQFSSFSGNAKNQNKSSPHIDKFFRFSKLRISVS